MSAVMCRVCGQEARAATMAEAEARLATLCRHGKPGRRMPLDAGVWLLVAAWAVVVGIALLWVLL